MNTLTALAAERGAAITGRVTLPANVDPRDLDAVPERNPRAARISLKACLILLDDYAGFPSSSNTRGFPRTMTKSGRVHCGLDEIFRGFEATG